MLFERNQGVFPRELKKEAEHIESRDSFTELQYFRFGRKIYGSIAKFQKAKELTFDFLSDAHALYSREVSVQGKPELVGFLSFHHDCRKIREREFIVK